MILLELAMGLIADIKRCWAESASDIGMGPFSQAENQTSQRSVDYHGGVSSGVFHKLDCQGCNLDKGWQDYRNAFISSALLRRDVPFLH